MGYYVYVLKSDSSGKSYIGQSKDLINRLKEHNSGENKSTRGKGPWKLVYFEKHETRSEAVKREMYYKTQIGRLKLKEEGILT